MLPSFIVYNKNNPFSILCNYQKAGKGDGAEKNVLQGHMWLQQQQQQPHQIIRYVHSAGINIWRRLEPSCPPNGYSCYWSCSRPPPPPLLFFHQNGITIFGPSRRCSLQLHLQDLNSSHTEIDGELSYCGVKTSLKALSSLIFSLSHAHKYTASKLNYI